MSGVNLTEIGPNADSAVLRLTGYRPSEYITQAVPVPSTAKNDSYFLLFWLLSDPVFDSSDFLFGNSFLFRPFAALNIDQLKTEITSRGYKTKVTTKADLLARLNKIIVRLREKRGNAHEWLGAVNKEGAPASFQFYKEYFNAVDRFNFHFYEIQWQHKVMNPHTLVVWSILNILFVNSWVIYCEVNDEKIPLKEFARQYIETTLPKK